MRLTPVFFLLVLVLTTGCERFQVPQAKNMAIPSRLPSISKFKSYRPAHRFVLTRLDFNVAFDSQTGQVCKTWEWDAVNPNKSAPGGKRLPVVFGEFAPTCLSLYENFPSVTDTAEPASTDSGAVSG